MRGNTTVRPSTRGLRPRLRTRTICRPRSGRVEGRTTPPQPANYIARSLRVLGFQLDVLGAEPPGRTRRQQLDRPPRLLPRQRLVTLRQALLCERQAAVGDVAAAAIGDRQET